MRYFEIKEITEEEYLDKTKDPLYSTAFEQSLIPVDRKVYCSTIADKVDFNVSMFDNIEE